MGGGTAGSGKEDCCVGASALYTWPHLGGFEAWLWRDRGEMTQACVFTANQITACLVIMLVLRHLALLQHGPADRPLAC